MNRKISYIIIAIFIAANSLSGQQLQWAKHIGSTGFDHCLTVSDDQNNIYASGHYYRKLSLPNDTLTSLGHNDMYLAKFDAAGNEIWARTFGGLNPYTVNVWEYLERNSNIKYDPITNSIYVSGYFYSTMKIDGIEITSTGGRDLYLAKFNSNGECEWLMGAGSAVDDYFSTFGIDKYGNIYWSGHLNANGYIDSNTYNNNTFLCKIQSDRTILWTKQIIENGEILSIIISENNIFFDGMFKNTTILDTIVLTSNTDFDFIMGKYNLSTNHIEWVHQLSGGIEDENNVSNMLLTQNSRLIYYCTFRDSINIHDSTIFAPNHKSNILILELDTLGQICWFKQYQTQIGSPSFGGNIIELDDSTFYIAGTINSETIFGADTISVEQESAYVIHIDKFGNYIDIITFGKAQSSTITLLENGTFAVSGLQKGTTTIGDTTFTNFLGDQVGEDCYIAKFDAITGMQTISKPAEDKLFIYANPTSGLCTINIPSAFEHEKNLILYVYDQQGRLLKEARVELDAENIRLNMEALAKGMYTAVLSNGKMKFSGKIVFQ